MSAAARPPRALLLLGTMQSGNLFPIPLVEEEGVEKPGLSRCCRQRVLRRRSVQSRCNEVVAALNWMAGCSSESQGMAVSPVHEEVLARIERLVRKRTPDSETPSTEEAARALLRAKFGYDMADAVVAPFQSGLVSLPGTVTDSPFADELGPDETRRMLEGFTEQFLRPVAEVDRIKRDGAHAGALHGPEVVEGQARL